MAAAVERPDRDYFERDAGDECRSQRHEGAEHETSGQRGKGRGEIGAEHVERAVRQVDQVHDAEDQRQPGGEQEQQHAELHAVEKLLDEIEHGEACSAETPTLSSSAKADDPVTTAISASRGDANRPANEYWMPRFRSALQALTSLVFCRGS